MCYKVIETHACGHKIEDPIPCEGKIAGDTCSTAKEANQDRHEQNDEQCRPCQMSQARKEEEEDFENALEAIANDPKFAPVPKSGGAYLAPQNLGPILSVKRWKNCGHISDPVELEVIREHEKDPKWIETEQPYFECPGCTKMMIKDPHTLGEMKVSGKLDCDNPWGAMNAAPEVAASGSGTAKVQSDFDVPDVARSRSPSPDQIATLKGKGKGRAGRPEETYADRYGAAEPEGEPEEEPEDEDEGDEAVHGDDGQHPEYPPSDDEEEDVRGRKANKLADGGSSRAASVNSASTARRARSSSSHYSHDDKEEDIPDWSSQAPPGGPPPRNPARLDANAAMASGALPPPATAQAPPINDPIVTISDQEAAKWMIPPALRPMLTQTRFDLWKQRVVENEQKAKDQDRNGLE